MRRYIPNAILRLLRRLGLYKGPIHYRMNAKPGRFGFHGKDAR